MRFSVLRRVSVVGVSLAFALILGMPPAHTQEIFDRIAQNDTSASTLPASPPPLAGSGTDRDSRELEIRIVRSGFQRIRLMAYLSFALGLLASLAVFVYRRRLMKGLHKTLAAITAVLVSLIAYAILVPAVSPPEVVRCGSALLRNSADAQASQDLDVQAYEDACRAARESAGDTLGLVSAYRSAFVDGTTSYVVAIDSGIVKFLSYFSVPLSCLGASLILQYVLWRMKGVVPV